MAEVDVLTEIDIDVPLERVAAFAADPDRVPEWYVNIRSVEWKTERPARVGSQIAFVAHFMGRVLAYTYEIVTWEAGKILVMRTAEGPFPMETSYRWESLSAQSTRMWLRNRGQPTGFSAMMSPLMSFMMRRANRKDLQALKKRLESDHGTKV